MARAAFRLYPPLLATPHGRHRPRHRAQGRLVQDEIRSLAPAPAGVQINNVGLSELEPRPLCRLDQLADFLEVLFLPAREIVQTDHPLVEFDQRFEQMGADEAGDTGDEPSFWRRPEFVL